jgi:hypothetical protein
VLNAAFLNVNVRPKLKNCLFPAPERPLENVVTRNIFLLICYDFFFFFGYRKSWLEVPILFQNLRSELVYTFKWTKSVARLWRNQICEWTQSILKKNSLYLPTHRWNGGSGVGNEHIFKGGLSCTFVMHSWEKREKMDSYTCNISDLTIVIEIYVQSNLFK